MRMIEMIQNITEYNRMSVVAFSDNKYLSFSEHHPRKQPVTYSVTGRVVRKRSNPHLKQARGSKLAFEVKL
jgi:hypothetical protein